MFTDIKYFPTHKSNKKYDFVPYQKKGSGQPLGTLQSGLHAGAEAGRAIGANSTLVNSLNFAKTALNNPQYAGERHAVLQTGVDKDGYATYERGNYIGPGTAVTHRVKKGDRGETYVDKLANKHDVAYTLAADGQDVRKADEDMMEKVRKAEKEALDFPINLRQASLIGTKIKLEDAGLPNTAFASFGSQGLTASELAMYRRELQRLEKEGKGVKFDDIDMRKYKESLKKKPADRLRDSVIRKKRKKSKVPKRIRKRIEKAKVIEDQFAKAKMTENVKAALSLF